ncbi:hypothetical protein Patl1_00433 [Pistacia atlantica]|uniref:Uncharacterized protein n=1 Tax=Pistacia atlantica TaxID=434234 RepID=A0ACC1CAX6_9ROSI|nr:hypothetical protein Patl1_00433 [Pistacia atlantica]
MRRTLVAHTDHINTQNAFPNASPAKAQADNVAEEDCQGGSDEECLMRRTLVAHTDHINTQNAFPNASPAKTQVVWVVMLCVDLDKDGDFVGEIDGGRTVVFKIWV